MEEKLQIIQENAIEELNKIETKNEIEKLRVKFLGKKGELTLLLREMGSLPKEKRPVIGKMANEVRAILEKNIEKKKYEIENVEKNKRLEKEKIDISIPGDFPDVGKRHHLLKVKEELEDLFLKMGYDVVEGPEIDTVEQ